MTAKMPEDKIQPPRKLLTDLPEGATDYIVFTDVVVDEKDHGTYLNAEAKLYGKAGIETVKVTTLEHGYRLAILRKGFHFVPKSLSAWSFLPVAEIVEDSDPDPFHRVRV
jgi:hypothetical protein